VIDKNVRNNNNTIFNTTVSFNGKSWYNKFRKIRIKKVYRIIEEIMKKLKLKFYPNSYIFYPFFFSTQKENDIIFLFLHVDSGKYDMFDDVLFSSGNFFFLNFENNIISIPNLPVYVFFHSI
jgi:hypothetical protein